MLNLLNLSRVMFAAAACSLLLLLLLQLAPSRSNQHSAHSTAYSNSSWLINHPAYFASRQTRGSSLRNSSNDMGSFGSAIDEALVHVDGFTDGEIVDSVEHFFWGQVNGTAMEIGALDGSPATRSMTHSLEKYGWVRVLVEGNPGYRQKLLQNSPLAYSANAVLCEKHAMMHYANIEYVGGIVEFMSAAFVKNYHASLHKYLPVSSDGVSKVAFNVSLVDWASALRDLSYIREVECVKLGLVLRDARVSHVNLFILDVEGGELEVLKSVNWKRVTFDVLCVELDGRPPGYADSVRAFLEPRGYFNHTSVGRNTWFVSRGFVPSRKPGLSEGCFNGVRKAQREDAWFLNRRTPPFKRCDVISQLTN